MKLFYQNHSGFQFEHRVDRLDYPPHIHNAVELVFMEKGCSTVRCGTQTWQLRAGDIFVAFPNVVHSYENTQDMEGYVLILPVKPYLTAYGSTLTEQIPEVPCIRKGNWEHTGLAALTKQAYADQTGVSEAVMQGYIQAIFGKLLPLLKLQSASGGSGEALRAVVTYIARHYRQGLSRSEIARAVGYNESYISHLFSGMLHTTVPEYIHTLRMYDARELLLRTDMTVSRIAGELGFGSIRNFNRVFQKETGLSPTAYRAAQNRK